ncbi:MAG TPA: DUF4199 domain-containing protein [Bacteroides sp.]|nr:DUF4199 domain-containing protein [Bacteroides sp.]
MEEKIKRPFLKPALIYGTILGVVGILLSLIFYFLDLTFKSWTQWLSLAVGIVVLTYCLIAYRKEYMGGFASYGRLFLMALAIGFTASVIGAVFTYILYAFIDPELLEKSRIVAQEAILNNTRIPESMHDDVLERIDKRMTLPRMIRSSLVMGTILYMVIGLIAAAFVKKEETPVDAV